MPNTSWWIVSDPPSRTVTMRHALETIAAEPCRVRAALPGWARRTPRYLSPMPRRGAYAPISRVLGRAPYPSLTWPLPDAF